MKLTKTPLSLILFHLIIWVMAAITLHHMILVKEQYDIVQSVAIQQKQENELIQQLSVAGNYLQSDTYRLRFMKSNQNRKLVDEKIIDTTSWESNTTEKVNYIPVSETALSTPQVWWKCLVDPFYQCIKK